MGIGLSSGFAAGAGADALQEEIKQKAEEVYRNAQIQQEQQKLALAAKAQQDATDIKRAQLQAINDEREANATLRKQTASDRLVSNLSPDQDVSQGTIDTATAGGLGDLFKQKPNTLSSTNYSGSVDTGGPALRILGLAQTANPGRPQPGGTFSGTAKQQQAAQQRAAQLAFMNDPSLSPEAKLGIRYQEVFGHPAPGPLLKDQSGAPQTSAEADAQARALYTKKASGIPLSPLENAQLGAWLQVKTAGPEASAAAAAARQAQAERAAADRRAADNPQIPNGAQAYLVQLAAKYPGDYAGAVQEFQRALPQLRADHPTLAPALAADSLKRIYGSPNPETANQIIGDALRQQQAGAAPMVQPSAGGGRGGAPAGAPATRILSVGGKAPASVAARPATSQGRPGFVRMQAPPEAGGGITDVPAADVDHYKARGARVVGGG